MKTTVNTSTNEFRAIFNQFIIDCCENDEQSITTAKDAYIYIKERFNSEYRHKQTMQGLIDWLQGLAIHTPFCYCDIIDLAKSWGTLNKDASEKQEEKFATTIGFSWQIIYYLKYNKLYLYCDYKGLKVSFYIK